MKITFLGHSGFLIESEISVVIDPFLTGNPKAGIPADGIEKADIVLVTHSHPDHLGDAVAISKRTRASFVSIHELTMIGELDNEGEGMNFGGTIDVQGLPITMVKAEHSTDIGDAGGFVWKQGGKTLYHMGDTSLFSDIKLIGETYRPDIAFVPIGDRYTMGPEQAAVAAEWVGAKTIIPMHYGTFPFLVQSADSFTKMVKERCDASVVALNPGGSMDA